MQVSTLCIGEYPNNVFVDILNTDNTLINSTSVLTMNHNNQLMITEFIAITLHGALNTFIINVLLSNNGGEFNDIPSFVFGKILLL